MPTLFALLASRIALLEQEGLYRYKPELVPTAVPQYGTCWYRGTVVPTVPWYHGTYRYQRLPGGFIIVPRYMCPPLHLALWGLMGPSQGCTLHRRLYAPPPAPQSPWFERSGGFSRPRAPHGGALRATFRTRICSFQAYRGCKSVVTDLVTHAHGLVRLPAARITRETFNCSNPCTERGKMGAECKGDQISAYRCIVR